jgi:hypothetical protein
MFGIHRKQRQEPGVATVPAARFDRLWERHEELQRRYIALAQAIELLGFSPQAVIEIISNEEDHNTMRSAWPFLMASVKIDGEKAKANGLSDKGVAFTQELFDYLRDMSRQNR